MIGTTISHYRVLERLGAGGMGEVYLAEDTRLGRRVALKILAGPFARDPAAGARFLREARAASRLDHPHICAVYDVVDTDDGRALIAMAFCEGESLKDRMARGRLGVAEAVDIACQVADGLAEAHAHGIVHRDIKPANVMITRGSRAKIVDFGLAVLPDDEHLTATGVTLGTPAYMAPEQARGEEADQRTDLWAVGVVLYEMLTGRRPFPDGPPAAALYAVVNRAPEPVDRTAPGLPADLVRIVNRALVKDPLGRYQQAEQMLADLKACRDRLSGTNLQATSRAGRPASIAVLPFANLSPEADQEYFCDGMTEELMTALGSLEGVRVAAKTSTFQLKGQGLGIRQIGEQLRVDTVVEGSVRKAGDRLRITAQLVNASDGYHLWSGRFDRRLDDVFAVQDEIAGAIVEKLKGQLTGQSDTGQARRRATSPDVYELYLKGRYCYGKRYQAMVQPAVDAFRRATELDPDFAPAHAGLADSLSLTGWFALKPLDEVREPAMRAAERAVELDGGLAEAHHALAMVHLWFDWEWEVIEREFRRAISLNPSLPLTHAYYALALTTTDRLEEVRREIEAGLALDPLSPLQLSLASAAYRGIRDDHGALACGEKAVDVDPDSLLGLHALGWALSSVGRHQEAVDALARCVTETHRMPYYLMFLGEAFVRAGRDAEATAIADELVERGLREPSLAGFAGYVQLALGNFDAALASMERAAGAGAKRGSPLSFMAPVFDPYRGDPRFAKLLRAAGYTGTALLTRGVPEAIGRLNPTPPA